MSVKVEGVAKNFGSFSALDGVDLDIDRGEIFSIVGPSGSGKTTLLRVIAGLEVQDRGHVYISGRQVDDLDPAKRNVGMVFQNYALYPNKSVYENIASPLFAKGVQRSEAARMVTEIASKLDIGEILDRLPSEISGGQQQRVALARALVKKPSVFLLDEPLSNLDAQIRFFARRFIKELQREFGITTVYVTHDQSEALSIADRVAVIHKGRIQQVGTPAEVYETPVNDFVANFLGSPPINFFDAKYEGDRFFPVNLPFKLESSIREELKVGVRPESIIIGAGENTGKVTGVDYLGREYILYLSVDGSEFRALVHKLDGLKIGSTVKFDIQRKGVMVFDKSSGQRVQ
jgi:multiple sugar transport system ATP-binding protein